MNKIGYSGATSLSEVLNVNSSLTQLELGLSLLLNIIKWLLFNHIPYGTILEIQEQHHYQKYWRLIHHSLNWTCGSEFINEYDWLIIIQSHSFCNKIGESGLEVLADALESNITITQIRFWPFLWFFQWKIHWMISLCIGLPPFPQKYPSCVFVFIL